MSIYDNYIDQIITHGKTPRNRSINLLQRVILHRASGNPSYKPIRINGTDTYAIINSKDDYHVKEIVCMPGQTAPIGSDVVFCNAPWLVVSADIDDEVYGKSKMQLCNCVLKWKDANGIIHAYNAIAEDATKYSEGIESTQYMRIAEFQIKTKIHLDEYTATISRDMRFVIDAEKYIENLICNNDYPFVFRVTRRNVVTGTYANEGYVEITLVQDQWIEGKDDYHNVLAAQPYELQEPYPITKPSDDVQHTSTEGRWL